jgi:hypothetical protein
MNTNLGLIRQWVLHETGHAIARLHYSGGCGLLLWGENGGECWGRPMPPEQAKVCIAAGEVGAEIFADIDLPLSCHLATSLLTLQCAQPEEDDNADFAVFCRLCEPGIDCAAQWIQAKLEARAILLQHRAAAVEIAERLLNERTMTGEQINRIWQRHTAG